MHSLLDAVVDEGGQVVDHLSDLVVGDVGVLYALCGQDRHFRNADNGRMVQVSCGRGLGSTALS